MTTAASPMSRRARMLHLALIASAGLLLLEQWLAPPLHSSLPALHRILEIGFAALTLLCWIELALSAWNGGAGWFSLRRPRVSHGRAASRVPRALPVIASWCLLLSTLAIPLGVGDFLTFDWNIEPRAWVPWTAAACGVVLTLLALAAAIEVLALLWRRRVDGGLALKHSN